MSSGSHTWSSSRRTRARSARSRRRSRRSTAWRGTSTATRTATASDARGARRPARGRVRRDQRRGRRGRLHRHDQPGGALIPGTHRLRLAVVPSYVIYARKQAPSRRSSRSRPSVRPERAARRDRRAHETRLHLPTENRPATMNTAGELDASFDRVPGHVLTVVDQAYFEYIDRPDYPDAVERYSRRAVTSRSCGRSRRSTGWPDCVSATPSRRARCARRWRRCAVPSTDDVGAGRRDREHRRRRRDRAAPQRERGGSSNVSRRCSPAIGSNRSVRRRLLYVDTGADADALFNRCCTKGSSCGAGGLRLTEPPFASWSARRKSFDLFAAALDRALQRA